MSNSPAFFEKLSRAIERNDSLLCVGLDPDHAQTPQKYRTKDGDPASAMLNWNQAIIEQTADLVCAYKPNIAFYEALGSPGMEVLRRTLTLIPPEIPVLLDAKRGDIGSTAAAYATACFEVLGVDGVTLSPYLGRDSVEPFARYAGKGLFVLCHTSNIGAGEFQELEVADWRALDREPNRPLYIHVARTAIQWSPDVGLVVGATFPAAIAEVRAVAQATWFLVPGIGTQGGDLEATIAAGARNSDGMGLIINASRQIAHDTDHRMAANVLRSAINGARRRHLGAGVASAAPPQAIGRSELWSLVEGLFQLGAIKFGDFTLASGMQSPIYVDLRLLISRPSLLAQVAEAYAAILVNLPCDRIAGVPYAALPIGTAVAIATDIPLIYPRKEAKSYGLARSIEGNWVEGDRVIILEDLITSGGSTVKTAEQLRAAGLVVEHAIVLIDREQGGAANLKQAGITVHSVFRLSEMVTDLASAGLLGQDKLEEVLSFVGRS